MTEQEFNAAVAKMEAAVTDQAGLRPITRIDFEPIGHQVRWTIWEGERRLYVATSTPDDIDGFLAASRFMLRVRCGVYDQVETTAHV